MFTLHLSTRCHVTCSRGRRSTPGRSIPKVINFGKSDNLIPVLSQSPPSRKPRIWLQSPGLLEMESRPCEKCQAFFKQCPVYNEVTSKSCPGYWQKYHDAFWQLKAAAEDGCCLCILFLEKLESELEKIGQQYKTVDPDKIIDMRAILRLNGSSRRVSACWTVNLDTPSNLFVIDKHDYEHKGGTIRPIELHPFDPAARSSKYDPKDAANTNNFLGFQN
jgi:hypothetical protein